MNASPKHIGVLATPEDIDRAASLVDLLAVCKYVTEALACDTYSVPGHVASSLRTVLELAEDMAGDQMGRFEQIMRGSPVENPPGETVDSGEKR